ncbi:MAG: hypothetical protein ABW221_17750 [Vicinamibacteria bacterium]
MAALGCLALAAACGRPGSSSKKELQKEVETLQRERDLLRARVGDLMGKEPRLQGMPETSVRVGIPTVLARTLIERVLGGVADQVTLELRNMRAHKEGTVKKIVTIGTYTLDVDVTRVRGQLRTGTPELTFGGDQVAVALPVSVASGTGDAKVRFTWDGRNVGGAVCGDLDVTRDVKGSVKQATYPVRGTLALAAHEGRILATPRFPVTRVRLEVEPSKESWAEVQKLLDEREGVCGFLVDKIDITKVVRDSLAKGFNVRLPTEKLKPVAIPVGIEPQIAVAGKTLHFTVELGGLAITEHALWIGANVKVTRPAAAPAVP